jgi:hypothetical protein
MNSRFSPSSSPEAAVSAADARRREDVRRLHAICSTSGGRLQVISTKGDPPQEVTITLACRTAASAGYPNDVSRKTTVRVQFPERYPFQEPIAQVLTPIFHPNVYSSGRICFGTKWLPTEGLDLLVRRIIHIVTFDPDVVNVSSPANGSAAVWYRSSVEAHPTAFPTDTLNIVAAERQEQTMQWRDLTSPSGAGATDGTRVVLCSSCTQSLRVPDMPGMRRRCPKCGNVFAVSA